MEQGKARNKDLLHSIVYMLKILQKYNRCVMPVFFAMVFVNGIFPLFLVYLPKYIVSYLTQYQPVGRLLLFFAVAGACLITAKLLAVILNNRYELYIGMARTDCYESMLILKTFSLEYALLEAPDIQDLLTKARQISWSQNSGAEGTLRELGVILGSVTTLIGYVLILIQLNLILPLILSLLVAVNLFIKRPEIMNSL